MVRVIRTQKKVDWILVAATVLIPLLGLVVLYSAGFDPNSSGKTFEWWPYAVKSPAFMKQLIFIIVGFVIMTVMALLPPPFYYRISLPMYLVGIVLLILVARYGTIVNGSRRWLTIGSTKIQPAEFMKIGVVLAMARYLSQYPPPAGGYRLKNLIIPAMIFLVPMALIIKQPDLGTSLSVGAVGGAMMLVAGVRLRTLLFLMVVGVASVVPLWYKLHPYQKNRVLALFNPDLDPKGTGYHIIQSKIAVGSGELFGKGYLEGTQTQLEFLPEHTTDFIFSVLAEEWGFVGCISVIFCYFLFLYLLLRVALKTKDFFSAFVTIGITALIFFHAFVNIGMVVGLLPVVGIPLPLFSYGGSSVISSLVGVGLVMSVSLRRVSSYRFR
jgi:rod shape determining protein RodA